jgi:GNAT superfamily N-acetyltransferase
VRIEALTAGGIFAEIPALSDLLRACVQGGASIGFVWPMADGEAEAYWRSTTSPVTKGTRVLLVARDDAGVIVGTGQLDLAMRANGMHRAEVMKMMVRPSARKSGIGRAIMQRLEEEAHNLGRTTLHLDTVDGNQAAERLYQSQGWTKIGGIPNYATNIDGVPERNAIYYKLLGTQSAVGTEERTGETATG